MPDPKPRRPRRRPPRPWRPRRRGRDQVAATVVDAVRQQTSDADDLARIPGQDLLADPQTNPAVRRHADQLRDDQHRHALDAEHTRALRRHRVADRRAEHAELALEAIRAAREASSPAKSVLALHMGRRRFMGLALAASLALSAGSAMGVASFARHLGVPPEIGYIAEVGLTGLTTTVILYRSHLAQHGGRVTGWESAVLWVLMVGPLLAAMTANALGSGPVGTACSVGAAAFSLLSHIIADTSAAALRAQAGQVTGADEAQLRAIATGDEPAGPPLALHAVPGGESDDEGDDEGDLALARLQQWRERRRYGISRRAAEPRTAPKPHGRAGPYGLLSRFDPATRTAVHTAVHTARTEVRTAPSLAPPAIARPQPVRPVLFLLEPRTGVASTGALPRTGEPAAARTAAVVPARNGRTDQATAPAHRAASPEQKSKAEWIAKIAEEIREAQAAGRTWRPDYPVLERRTGRKRSWCEKTVHAAREKTARTNAPRTDQGRTARMSGVGS